MPGSEFARQRTKFMDSFCMAEIYSSKNLRKRAEAGLEFAICPEGSTDYENTEGFLGGPDTGERLQIRNHLADNKDHLEIFSKRPEQV